MSVQTDVEVRRSKEFEKVVRQLRKKMKQSSGDNDSYFEFLREAPKAFVRLRSDEFVLLVQQTVQLVTDNLNKEAEKMSLNINTEFHYTTINNRLVCELLVGLGPGPRWSVFIGPNGQWDKVIPFTALVDWDRHPYKKMYDKKWESVHDFDCHKFIQVLSQELAEFQAVFQEDESREEIPF